jgi:hypothetical protein
MQRRHIQRGGSTTFSPNSHHNFGHEITGILEILHTILLFKKLAHIPAT